MARGALKGLKRTRPAPGEKVVVRGQVAQGGADRGAQGSIGTANGGADLDSGDLISWLNCECFFSLVLVGLLAALPFNLHTQELMQTPETYVNRAMEFAGEGAFDKAASLYERAVSTEETAERHVLLAEALVMAERKNEALWHFRRAAELYEDRPHKVSALTSLGQVQTEEGYSDDAVETYLHILELQEKEDPVEAAEAHLQVATSMLDSQDHSHAVAHLEMAAALDPELSEAQDLLAHTLRDMGAVDEAIRLYETITADPSTDIEALVQLGYAHHEVCDFEQALAIYKKARSSPTKAMEMDYLTAALHSVSFRPARAPVAYVADLFDLEARKSSFSASKEQVLMSTETNRGEFWGASAEAARLGANRSMFYDVHGLIFDRVAPNIRSMVVAALGIHPDEDRHGATISTGGDLRWLDILDLGCGRGAMGIEFRRLANYMIGVDLSQEALKHAARTEAYDSIRHGDAVALTKAMLPDSFDVVVAADMMPYFGDLGDVLKAIAAVTRPGGLVVFNIDALDREDDVSGSTRGGASGRPYELRFTGRWSHHRKYVTQSVNAAELSVLGVRIVKGQTRLLSPTAGEIVLEEMPQEVRSVIFLCGKGPMV